MPNKRIAGGGSASDQSKVRALAAPSVFDCLVANLAAIAIAQGGSLPLDLATPDAEEEKHLNGELQ